MIKIKYIVSIFIFTLFINSALSFGQYVTIKGSVTDKISHKAISGVSVQVKGYKGTLSDNNGNFNLIVDSQFTRNRKLIFSYIGYQQQGCFISNKFYNINLSPLENNLKEIVVSTNGLTIVEKAIRNISANAPNKPICIIGIKRIYNIINDSDYYYKSDAKLNHTTTGPNERGHLKTTLLQNQG